MFQVRVEWILIQLEEARDHKTLICGHYRSVIALANFEIVVLGPDFYAQCESGSQDREL